MDNCFRNNTVKKIHVQIKMPTDNHIGPFLLDNEMYTSHEATT